MAAAAVAALALARGAENKGNLGIEVASKIGSDILCAKLSLN